MKRRNFLGLGAAVLAAPTVLLAESEQGFVSRKVKSVVFKYPLEVRWTPKEVGTLNRFSFCGTAEKNPQLCAIYINRGETKLMSFGTSNILGHVTHWSAGVEGGIIFLGEERPVIEVIGPDIDWEYNIVYGDRGILNVHSEGGEVRAVKYYMGAPC